MRWDARYRLAIYRTIRLHLRLSTFEAEIALVISMLVRVPPGTELITEKGQPIGKRSNLGSTSKSHSHAAG
jgi:hypothetical protein